LWQKIDLCCQEADESQLWLELLREECGISAAKTDPIWKEADELISIFVTMSKNTKTKESNPSDSGFKFQVSSFIIPPLPMRRVLVVIPHF